LKVKSHLSFALVLALLSLMPGLGFVTGGMACASGDTALTETSTGQTDSDDGVVDTARASTCVAIQRGFFGEVADGYIWSAVPDTSYNTDSLYTGLVDSGETRSLIRFSLDFLPEGAVVQSALFGVQESGAGSGETVTIYRITEPWSEGEPTWDSFANNYDDSVAWGSFVANGPGVLGADITGLVAAWVDGKVPNYGLLLKNSSGQAPDQYVSSDAESTYRPGLLVCYVENRDPIAADDAAVTDEDVPVDVDVLANDSDLDGDALTVSSFDSSSAQGGTVSCTGAGVCTYTPPDDFNGTDVFTYTISDGNGGTDTAVVTVTVTPVNDPPVAVDDSATTEEGEPVDVDVLANDSDPDGDTLTVSSFDSSSTQGGTVSCTDAGMCTYTPPGDFNGTDTFTYTISDGNGGADTATVTVTVTATVPSPGLIYLPLVLNQRVLPPAPDLVVARITVTSNDVQVVIKNQGDRPVLPPDAFWVDLYVDPNPVPTGVNQTWPSRCSYGIAWGIPEQALPLSPGGTITLTINDAYYTPDLSNFPGSLPAGTPIYVQVDSANVGATYGAVLEGHEMVGGPYNNVSGPVLSTLSAMEESGMLLLVSPRKMRSDWSDRSHEAAQ